VKGFFTDLRSEVIAPSNDLWVERSYDFIDRCSLHPFSGGCEGSIVPFDSLFAGFDDGRIPLSCHVFSDWILPDRETKKVEAHVSVAFLLCFKGVGVSCFGILQFSSHAFEPFLDSLFTPLDAFPRIPTVSPLLTPAASRNLSLLQSLPTSIPYRQGNVRRRKDDPCVGTAARRNVERLYRFPRRLPSDGGSSGRVRRALSTGSGDRSRPAPHASLPPGASVPFATQECRGHRGVGRCRATSHARLHRYRTMGASTVAPGVGWASGRSIGRARWHHRFRSQQFPQTRHALGGRQTTVVWPPGEGRQLPGRRLHGLRLCARSCLARLPVVPARGLGTRRATTPGMPRPARDSLPNASGAVFGDARRVA